MRGALILVLALAACSSESADEANGVEVTVSPTPTPTIAAMAGVEPADKSTPISQQSYDFAGAWAVSEALCRNNGQWRFTRQGVETDGETSCSVASTANETGVGVTLNMSCTAEGTTRHERWELLTAPEGGMIVQRYVDNVMTGPQQRLMRCAGA